MLICNRLQPKDFSLCRGTAPTGRLFLLLTEIYVFSTLFNVISCYGLRNPCLYHLKLTTWWCLHLLKSNLNFNQHVKIAAQSCFYQLHRISVSLISVCQEANVDYAFITSGLFYYSLLLYSLSIFQLIQNAAATLLELF